MWRIWIIERLLSGMGLPERHYVLTKAVRKLFNTVSDDDILHEENGIWFVEGKAITDSEKKLLVSEAHTFAETRFWKVLQRDVEYQANKRMFVESKSELDMIAGKLILYVLDIMRTRIKSITQRSSQFRTTAQADALRNGSKLSMLKR